MKLSEIIEHVDGARPNAFKEEVKVDWLNELEGSLQANLMKRPAVREHVWRIEWDGMAEFRDGCRMAFSGHFPGWPGGVVEINSAEGLEDNLQEELEVLAVEDRPGETVLVFADGSFPTDGEAKVELRYDGSGDILLLPALWKKVYYTYLDARVCAGCGEWAEYANQMQIYNQFANELGAWYCENYVDR